MRTGRPKGFDEAEALERALELFWLNGYKRTGMAELLRALGISRQSLYDTFGNKRALFLQVLHHYRDTQLSEALALLAQPGSQVSNVKAVVRFFETLGSDPRCRGCLVANSVVEFGPTEDEEIVGLLRETLSQLERAVRTALEQAQKLGELPAAKSPEQISRALTNSMLGMAVTGRLRMDQGALQDVYAGTLAMLD